MPAKPYDFVGIGNAAVDIILNVDYSFLEKWSLPHAACAFPTLAQLQDLETAIADENIETLPEPGGSAANSCCTVGALGGKALFLGRTSKDAYGDLFDASMDKWAVTHPLVPFPASKVPNTRIYTFVTPDKERTFAIYPGASGLISNDDIPEEHIASGFCLGLDGYLLSAPGGFEVSKQAMRYAAANGVLSVFNPSTPSLIQNKRDQIDLLVGMADGIICNEQEAQLLTGIADIGQSAQILAKGKRFAVITLGAEGAHAIIGGAEIRRFNPKMPEVIVNTNGAGDNFAGGFLYGLARDMGHEDSVDLGLRCAVSVLESASPRPAMQLTPFLKGR